MLNVEVKKLDKLKRKLSIQVGGDEFSKTKKELYTEIGKQLKVPGFRPGNVPIDVLEKQHGKLLKEKFLEQAIPLYYRKAIEEEKISPASTPNIYDVDLSQDALRFNADVEIRPQVDVEDKDFKGIKIKTKKVVVEEIEIEKVLTNIKDSTKKVIQKDLNDDELAKWSGYSDAASLREAVRAQLHVEKLKERRNKIDSQIGQHLLKSIKVDVPQSEAEQARQELLRREMYNLRLRGIPEADIEKYKKDIEEKLETIAQEQIKLSYIIRAIAQKESINIEDGSGEGVLGFILSCAQYQQE